MENLQNITSESKYSKHNKRNDGNYFLTAQIQTLEEKLRESQKQFEQDLHLEREIARKNVGRIEKSKLEEIEYLKWSLTSKEEDIESMKKELNAVMTENEKLKYDKLRTEDKLIDLQQQMTYIEGEMKRLKDFHGRELNVLISERNTLFARTADQDETDSNKAGKQVEMSRLISENSELKRRLQECEADFLALSVKQGQSILQITSSDNTWLQEIDGYTKDEVIDLLVKEKDGNFRLREYVNRILTRIIEKDPSLLEI